MQQELSAQQAVAFVIETRKGLVEFYHGAAAQTDSQPGRAVFARLAEETRRQLAADYRRHLDTDAGGFESFMAAPLLGDSVQRHNLTRAPARILNDHQAREIAMREELDAARRLELYAARVLNPLARDILLQAAHAFSQHAQIIESEYAHTMGMVHETDIDTFVRE